MATSLRGIRRAIFEAGLLFYLLTSKETTHNAEGPSPMSQRTLRIVTIVIAIAFVATLAIPAFG